MRGNIFTDYVHLLKSAPRSARFRFFLWRCVAMVLGKRNSLYPGARSALILPRRQHRVLAIEARR